MIYILLTHLPLSGLTGDNHMAALSLIGTVPEGLSCRSSIGHNFYTKYILNNDTIYYLILCYINYLFCS